MPRKDTKRKLDALLKNNKKSKKAKKNDGASGSQTESNNDDTMDVLLEVSMLYQIPQFALMTFGEVLFSVGGLEFTYSQAAPSMRSVMQALWLLTVFFGNLIAMVISGSHVIPGPEWEFFTYAIFMGVVMVVFVFLAWRYKYVEPDDFIVEEDEIALKELGSPD